MRVLFVTPMFPNPQNPQDGNFVMALAQCLREHGIDVRVAHLHLQLPWPLSRFRPYRRTVVAGEPPAYEHLVRVPAQQLPANALMIRRLRLWACRVAGAVKRAWSDWKPDLIHAHTILPAGAVSSHVAAEWSIPCLATSHGADTRVHRHRRGPRKVLENLLQGGLNVIAVGDVVAESLRELVVDPRQIHPIYNGLALEAVTAAPPALLEQYGKNRVVLAAGNIVPSKGFDVLLKAACKLAESHTDVRYLIIGGGSSERQVRRLRTELNLGACVEILGPLPHHRLMEYMDLCDVFCLPSWSEAFGIVYLEAMASGKPVIGVEGQGVYRIVQKHDVGLLTSPRDHEQVAAALRCLLDDRELRERMGQRAKELAWRECSWSHCAQHHRGLYEEMIADHRRQ